MSTERWLRVKGITSDALERAETERPSFLTEACAGDEALRREVESLLTAHARAGDFLETPGLAGAGAAGAVARVAEEGSMHVAAGRRVGPYRILEELGHGGMGVVYLAERADAAFEKQVAIKVARGGFASESLMERFREERRILATLDHPNIARLLDGGTIEDGSPYLVMEYVDGVPLDVYSETAPLSTRATAALVPPGLLSRAVRPPAPGDPSRPQGAQHPGDGGRHAEAPGLRHREAAGAGARA